MAPEERHADRRHFIKVAGAASALGAMKLPPVFAQSGNGHAIQLALVGAGGRGTGAVMDAITASSYPIKLVAMADLFQHRLDESVNALSQALQSKPGAYDVPEDRKHIGFDAYKKAMDALNPGDVVILATPLAFRGLHFRYAIERGLNVFMEKPLCADSIKAKELLELAKQADAKNIKAGVGLMVRHCRGRQELHKRIADGEIGDLIAMRAYRMHGPVGSCFSTRKPKDRDELPWQIERFHSFIWASGGLFNDFYIHQIDEVCWMKNAWPVKAQALGGRHYRNDYVDQNFDNYSVEYTFEDGTKYYYYGRTMIGCRNDFTSVVHGSKGSAIVSTSGPTPGKVRTFKDQKQQRAAQLWAFPQPEENPYVLEWKDLLEAIVRNEPYNEVERGVRASLVSNMGRMAAHTGEEITYEQILECPHDMAGNVGEFTEKGPAPVMPDADGKYPVPMPGVNHDQEYKTT
jgi:predicted dehydrogenase